MALFATSTLTVLALIAALTESVTLQLQKYFWLMEPHAFGTLIAKVDIAVGAEFAIPSLSFNLLKMISLHQPHASTTPATHSWFLP